jgi:hypothetical protein
MTRQAMESANRAPWVGEQFHSNEIDNLGTRLSLTALHTQEERTHCSVQSMCVDSDDDDEEEDASSSDFDDMEIIFLESVVRKLTGGADHDLMPAPWYNQVSLLSPKASVQRDSFHRVTPPYFSQQSCSTSSFTGSGPCPSYTPQVPSSCLSSMTSCNSMTVDDHLGSIRQARDASLGSDLHASITASGIDKVPWGHDEGVAGEVLGLVDILQEYMTDLDRMMNVPPLL